MAVPAETPVITPALMESTEVLLLLHVPPVEALDNVAVCPTHTAVLPVMGAGIGLTVMILEPLHPVASV